MKWIAIFLSVAGCCCHTAQDGPFEEAIETQIERFTGLDIDLTSEDGQ